MNPRLCGRCGHPLGPGDDTRREYDTTVHVDCLDDDETCGSEICQMAGKCQGGSACAPDGPPDLECTCTAVEDPWTYYGAVEPGGAMVPDPDCPVHFPRTRPDDVTILAPAAIL